jgi:hypothetical protein
MSEKMIHIDGCQIPCIPRIAEEPAEEDIQPLRIRIKRVLAVPWNYFVKKWLKRFYRFFMGGRKKILTIQSSTPENISEHPQFKFESGDWVHIRSMQEIEATLDPWKELKGCAFLPSMAAYCETNQKVLQPMQRFLDERDYKVKKVKGIVLLDGVMCTGTPVFGRCDRRCFFFWREEWLEKIS